VDYLLRAAVAAFPESGIERHHLRGAFAGLRPILDTYADDPSGASREEDIWEENGMLSVAGGKLTTWRSTAETAVDTALQLLPEERGRNAAACATKGTPLAGLSPANLGTQLHLALGLDTAVAFGMARRLGAVAWHAGLLARDSAELLPLAEGTDLSAAEVRAHLRWGAVLHLDDLLIRRLRVGMWHPEVAEALLPVIRPLIMDDRNWDARRWEKEEAAFHQALAAWTLAGIR
jgi:glycerol-3-phosphate dehydrogenase